MAKIELTQMRSAAGIVGLSLGLGLGGCSSSNGASPPTDGNSPATDAEVTCSKDPRAEVFMENLTHKGDAHQLSFVLTKATIEPPATGNNSWTVKIVDANGQPVKDAKVSLPGGINGRPADPWMPDHGHGSVGAAMSNGDGTYTIAPLYFFMAGIWSTYLSATTGSTTDSTTFTFCIGGTG
jgi:YtkA-like protein